MKYMIVFDEWDRPLIEEMITDRVALLREDHDAVNDRLATVLEALEIVPVPVTQTSLVEQVMHQSHVQDTMVRQQLIDSLQGDVDRLQATLHLITTGIQELHSHAWSPREAHVLAALYPGRDAVERMAANLAADRARSTR